MNRERIHKLNQIEIEIQVNIENSQPLVAFLERKAVFQSGKHQIDEYFVPPHRDFTQTRPVREWLRLRNSEGRYFITYKNWHYDKQGRSSYCDEYETEIGDLNSVKKILKVLDFKSIVIVDKTRKTWIYGDYRISLDSVTGLGDFVEIEFIGKSLKEDPKNITKEMIAFLKKIGCGEVKRNYKGYPFLLLFPNERKYEIQ